jgi:hypothetical protein
VAGQAFSDGVFASRSRCWCLTRTRLVGDERPVAQHAPVAVYLADATSFIRSAASGWPTRHLRRLRYVKHQVMRLNLLLMTVCSCPFRLAGGPGMRDANAERVAVISTHVAVISLGGAGSAVCVVARDPSRRRPEVGGRSRYEPGPPHLASGVPPCLPSSSQRCRQLHLVIALVLARARGDRRSRLPGRLQLHPLAAGRSTRAAIAAGSPVRAGRRGCDAPKEKQSPLRYSARGCGGRCWAASGEHALQHGHAPRLPPWSWKPVSGPGCQRQISRSRPFPSSSIGTWWRSSLGCSSRPRQPGC